MSRMICISLGLLLALPAQAEEWLPDPALAAQAIDARASVHASMRRVEAASAQARARAAGPHEFEISAIQQLRRADEALGRRSYDEFEVQLGRAFRWPGKVALDRQIGEHGATAAELRLDDARHQGARLLLERWMDWLGAAERLRQTDAQLASLTRERVALARRLALGDAARKDLDLLDVELAQSEAASLAASGELLDTRAALLEDFPELPLPEQAPAVSEPQALTEPPEVWASRIIDRSHEIAALETDADQADALAARARADRRPDPSLGLRLMSDRDGEERALGVVFSLPIGGRHRAALAEAESAQAEALHEDAAAMRQAVRRESEQTVRSVAQRRGQWLAQRRALQASSEASRRIRRGWELGELGLLDWLMAERMHRQIALAEASARVAAEQARLRVLVDSHEIWHDH